MKAELNTKNYNNYFDDFEAEFEDLKKLFERINKMNDFNEKICKAKYYIMKNRPAFDLKTALKSLESDDKNLLMSIAWIANSDKEFSKFFLAIQENKLQYLDIIKLKEKELENEQIHIYNQFIVFNYNRLNSKNSVSDLKNMIKIYLSGSLESKMDYIKFKVDSLYLSYLKKIIYQKFSC